MLKLSQIKLRTVFLLDALGALGSAFTNGVVVPLVMLGDDVAMFRALGAVAVVLMLYGLSIYFKVQNIRPWMLKALIFFNLSYCVLTALLIAFLPSLSMLGIAVLLVEILVVLVVVGFEFLFLKPRQSEATHPKP